MSSSAAMDVSERLLAKYALNLDFETQVRRAFAEGIHKAYAKHFYEFLEDEFPSQEAIAGFLALRDRSGVAHQRKKGVATGQHFTLALYQFGDRLLLPSREEAYQSGLISATEYVSFKELKKSNQPPTGLDRETIRYLITARSHEDWWANEYKYTANFPGLAYRKILSLVHAQTPKPWTIRTPRALKKFIAYWLEAFVLCHSALSSDDELDMGASVRRVQ